MSEPDEKAAAELPAPPSVEPAAPPPAEDAGADDHVPGGPVRVQLFGRTDVGQIREHNEDNFIIADLSRKSRGLLEAERVQLVGPRGSLMAVCDGMGGAAAGEVASQLAVDIIYDRMVGGDDPKDHDELARRMVRAIEEAGARIFAEAKADRTRRGMGTTSTVAVLLDEYLFLGQVGDSRGYIVREGKMIQATRDQSLVNQLIEAGQLTEEEAETFEHNNIILQALGTNETVQVDLTFVELRRGDVLMLCSDGLSGMLKNDEIRAILTAGHDPFDACRLFTDRANQAGGHDNITCIVARFEGAGLKKPEPDDPDFRYRKYPLPESGSGAGSTSASPPASVPTDGAPSSGLKVAHTIVSMNVGDIQAAIPDAFPGGPKAGDDDPVDLPIPPTPGWMIGLWVFLAIVIVAGAGFVLLR